MENPPQPPTINFEQDKIQQNGQISSRSGGDIPLHPSSFTQRTGQSEVHHGRAAFAVPQACPGIPLDWNIGPFYTTYPHQLHKPSRENLGFHFTSVSPDGRDFWIHAHSCSRALSENGGPCWECAGLRKEVDKLQDRARLSAAPLSMNYKFMNYVQSTNRMKDLLQQLNEAKLNVSNIQWSSCLRRLTLPIRY